MIFIVLVCIFSENPNRVLKWTTISYVKVVTAPSSVRFGMVLAFLHVHGIADNSIVIPFYYVVSDRY